MKKIGNIETYTLDELLDDHFGVVGTARRDEFERTVAEAVEAYINKKELKFNSLEEALDRPFGETGTPERDEHEKLVAESVEEYKNRVVVK